MRNAEEAGSVRRKEDAESLAILGGFERAAFWRKKSKPRFTSPIPYPFWTLLALCEYILDRLSVLLQMSNLKGDTSDNPKPKF